MDNCEPDPLADKDKFKELTRHQKRQVKKNFFKAVKKMKKGLNPLPHPLYDRDPVTAKAVRDRQPKTIEEWVAGFEDVGFIDQERLDLEQRQGWRQQWLDEYAAASEEIGEYLKKGGLDAAE